MDKQASVLQNLYMRTLRDDFPDLLDVINFSTEARKDAVAALRIFPCAEDSNFGHDRLIWE